MNRRLDARLLRFPHAAVQTFWLCISNKWAAGNLNNSDEHTTPADKFPPQRNSPSIPSNHGLVHNTHKLRARNPPAPQLLQPLPDIVERLAHDTVPRRPHIPRPHERGHLPGPRGRELPVRRGRPALVRRDPINGGSEGAHREDPGRPDRAARVACDREAVERDVAAAGGAEGLVADAHGVWRGDAVGGVGEAVGGEGVDISGAGWGGVVKGGGSAGGFDEGEVVRGAGDDGDEAAPGEVRFLVVRGAGEDGLLS